MSKEPQSSSKTDDVVMPTAVKAGQHRVQLKRLHWLFIALVAVAFGAANAFLPKPSFAATANTPLASGPIVGIASKCLGNSGNRLVNQNPIQLFGCKNTAAQKWSVMADGSIQNQGFCLDAKFSGTTPQTLVWLYAC